MGPEKTAAEAGFPIQEQIRTALLAMVYGDGVATTPQIYGALLDRMYPDTLSKQGKDSLRSAVNRDAVDSGLIERAGAAWRITELGRKRVELSRRYWAVPVDATFVAQVRGEEALDASSVAPSLQKQLFQRRVAVGDRLALCVGSEVIALGWVTGLRDGDVNWRQEPCSKRLNLALPGYEIKEITASDDRAAIWDEEPDEETSSYWKIAPGEQASFWKECREGGFIAIGWSALGDLTGLDLGAFRERLSSVRHLPKYGGRGPWQVWSFRNIPPHARVVANRGIAAAVGVGTVIGPYRFVEGSAYPHRLPVRWDDPRERRIDQPSFFRTLMPISKETFDAILAGELVDKSGPKPYTGPSNNVLLYGPPGTGKTYATIARAIELCGEKLPAAETDRQATFRHLQDEGRVAFVTFHQSYGYEEFVEGLRPRVAAGSVAYEVLPGAFKRLCTDAARNPHLQHTLVVDEINRGNVSRILGELITLLEPDKRLGASHELVVTLPYSGETFGVPRNLHVLGTLNTADRSIALLDVALRRRFTFEEVMPDSRVIRDVLKARGVPAGVTQLASSLLDTLNQRIAWLYDREHQLGHAFFLGVGEGEDGKSAPERAVADLRGVFVERVFPLLQEYFYGDWAKVCLVLGCPYDDAGALRRKGVAMRPVVTATVHAAKGLFGTRLDDDEERKVTYAFDRDFVAGKLSDDDTLAMLRGVLAEQVPM